MTACFRLQCTMINRKLSDFGHPVRRLRMLENLTIILPFAVFLIYKQQFYPIIISSHIFSTLSDTCDQIYLLNNGERENYFLSVF